MRLWIGGFANAAMQTPSRSAAELLYPLEVVVIL